MDINSSAETLSRILRWTRPLTIDQVTQYLSLDSRNVKEKNLPLILIIYYDGRFEDSMTLSISTWYCMRVDSENKPSKKEDIPFCGSDENMLRNYKQNCEWSLVSLYYWFFRTRNKFFLTCMWRIPCCILSIKFKSAVGSQGNKIIN